jgi:hypothetical protein
MPKMHQDISSVLRLDLCGLLLLAPLFVTDDAFALGPRNSGSRGPLQIR